MRQKCLESVQRGAAPRTSEIYAFWDTITVSAAAFRGKRAIFRGLQTETTSPLKIEFCIIDYAHETTQRAKMVTAGSEGELPTYVNYTLSGILYTIPYLTFSFHKKLYMPDRPTD